MKLCAFEPIRSQLRVSRVQFGVDSELDRWLNKSMKSLPQRVYSPFIVKDLKKKMVFLGGPRQVGKTTLALSMIEKKDKEFAYLNWDNEAARKTINNQAWDKEEPLIIFDEIHKRKGWQTLIKGAWDTWKGLQKYLITGSAQLDIFRKGGDSMLGRYHYYRIHPFTLSELGNNPENLKKIFEFGGFPEPLLEEDKTELRRWHLQRVSKLVRIDLRDLENISDLDKMEMLALALPERVASLLSYKSLSEDLGVSDKTIKRWVQVLSSLYYCYLIFPFGGAKIKAIKKTPKLYLWDWSQIFDESARFENMVASHLFKYCHFIQDTQGYRMELRFLRDKAGKETDFVVLKENKPLFAVECKLNDSKIDPAIKYFSEKLSIPKWYQVTLEGKDKVIAPNIEILSLSSLCKKLDLV